MGGQRLFALAGALAAGTLAAELLRPAPRALLPAALVASALPLMWRRLPALLLAASVLGLTLAGLRLASLEQAALAAGALAGADAVLTGEVMTDARVDASGARFAMRVASARIDGVPVDVHERAWVTVRPPPPVVLEPGALVRLDARLLPVRFPDMDAVGRAAARRLEHRGIAARAFASHADLEVTGRSGHPLVVVADAGRAAMRRAAEHVPPRLAGLFLGVTIGDVERMPAEVSVDFRRTGLTHLVAVSGANVAMVLGVVAGLLRLLRVGRRTTTGVLVACVLGFMAVTRFEPSVMRAGAMAIVALVGVAFGARRSATAVLGAAVLVLILHDPFVIHSIGFQLSVLATLGILLIAPHVLRALGEGPLAMAAAVTIGAQLAVLPLLLLHFHQLSIVSLAANLLVGPAVAPATVLGMISGALGMLWAPASAAAVAAIPALAWMQWTASTLSQLPLVSVGTPAGAAGLAIAAACGVLAVALARGWRPYRLGPVVLAVCLVATGGVWARALTTEPALEGLVIEMLDVGQGEAILLRSGGRTMLVDGGPDDEHLMDELRARGIGRIDVLIATHPHEDHVAGLVPVASSLAIGTALDPGTEDELPSWRAVEAALDARGVERVRATAGQRFALGEASIDVLWPPAEHLVGTEADLNNNSIVARVTYGTDSVLLSGEVEEAAMAALLDAGADLRARVLKVSHHGSARMLPEFYEASGASVAMIPVGRNTYGHPAPETLVALRGMQVMRSDLHGDVAIALDGRGGVTARPERAPDIAEMSAL